MDRTEFLKKCLELLVENEGFKKVQNLTLSNLKFVNYTKQVFTPLEVATAILDAAQCKISDSYLDELDYGEPFKMWTTALINFCIYTITAYKMIDIFVDALLKEKVSLGAYVYNGFNNNVLGLHLKTTYAQIFIDSGRISPAIYIYINDCTKSGHSVAGSGILKIYLPWFPLSGIASSPFLKPDFINRLMDDYITIGASIEQVIPAKKGVARHKETANDSFDTKIKDFIETIKTISNKINVLHTLWTR